MQGDWGSGQQDLQDGLWGWGPSGLCGGDWEYRGEVGGMGQVESMGGMQRLGSMRGIRRIWRADGMHAGMTEAGRIHGEDQGGWGSRQPPQEGLVGV